MTRTAGQLDGIKRGNVVHSSGGLTRNEEAGKMEEACCNKIRDAAESLDYWISKVRVYVRKVWTRSNGKGKRAWHCGRLVCCQYHID